MDHPFGQTMRIDIDPTAAPAADKPRRPRRRTPAGSTFVVRRRDRGPRNSPYDLLLESVYDGVLITDRAGTILDFNVRAEEFFRMDEARLLGLPVVELLSGADDTLVETIQSRLETHRHTLIEARCNRADGSSFPAEIAVNRLALDAEGQLCFFVRDISVRKRVLDELESAVERLQAHDRARMEFVSNVSHELRTPLTSMIYAVSNMLRGVVGPLPDKAVLYLERLEADCKRLLATVNDILDLRQIESHTLTLAKARLPLGPLVQTGVEALRVQAEAKRIKITLPTPAREWFALCDGQKMERVVLNVVGNAVKFTPEDGEVTVTVEPDPGQEGWGCISVCDTGVGIPKEALPKISQRYYRVGEHAAGSGLGLAISREIVELHGGHLDIISPVPGTDRGTAVRIRLPLVPSPMIVVVMPDQGLGDELRRQVESRGYRGLWLPAAQEALALCAAQQADLLIAGLCGCDAQGTEIFLQLRNDRRSQRMPAIALSREALSRGCQEILQKIGVPILPIPWRENELMSRISNAFSGRTVIARGSAPAGQAPATPSAQTRT
jgi:PAS domain S-box-containing protein